MADVSQLDMYVYQLSVMLCAACDVDMYVYQLSVMLCAECDVV